MAKRFTTRYSLLTLLLIVCNEGYSQKISGKYTLDEFLKLAQDLSIDAFEIRNTFISSYYSYIDFKTGYLPTLSFSSNIPNFNRSISWNEDLQDFVERNSMSNSATLSLSQNVAPTGGTLSMSSNLQQIKKFESNSTSTYLSSPFSLSYNQPIIGFNSMRWKNKTSPIEFEKAKRVYISDMEDNTITAVTRYFSMITAELSLQTAHNNYNSLDTLYKIAKERVIFGTISQKDVMQLQVLLLNAKTELINAQLNLEEEKQRMMKYLGLYNDIVFDLVLPDKPPIETMEVKSVLEKAQIYNTQILSNQLALLEADKALDEALKDRFSVNLNATYGYDHSAASSLSSLYEPPYSDRQQISVSLSVPIVDWGQDKRKVKLAQAKKELAMLKTEREQMSFEQNILVQIKRYNAQKEICEVSATTDSVANLQYVLTKTRFLIGKIDIEDINNALKEKDHALIRHISNLKSFWIYYYTFRKLTLYDFLKNQPLMEVYKDNFKP